MYFQDIQYNHLLYNTFGPICFYLGLDEIIKIQTNNGTGKTIFLKSVLGLLVFKKGLVLSGNVNNKNTSFYASTNINRLSNSQVKKFKLITSFLYKKNYWILDEPYSYLDITSIHYLKKKIIESTSKKYTIIITDCIKKTMLPTLIFYYGSKWI
jgi:ABC-type transport system involved in cytochrome c biogenesis ATPase subunit